MHAMRPNNDDDVYGAVIMAKQFQTFPFISRIQTERRWPSILGPSQPTWAATVHINHRHLLLLSPQADAGTYKYVGPPYCRAEMYFGRLVACCHLVSHDE